MLESTMQDGPLTIGMILRHGRTVYADSEVVTFEGETSRRATYAEVADRVDRLAAALVKLGVGDGTRVGTFCWNTQEHLEAYLAVPCMGAVLHTLNIRLFPEQLAYVINHAGDEVIIVDESITALLAKVAGDLTTVKTIVVTGSGDPGALAEATRARIVAYEDLLAGEKPGFDWPELDERSAAAMCYTSGTTGNPKGVVYSHRSTWLHSLASTSASALGLTEADRVLAIVPMFHVNAWGLPYAGWLVGTDQLMPGRFLQAEPLVKFIEAERPTFSGAVPTIWNDVLRYSREHPVDLSSFRMIICGGSAVPRSLIEAFETEHDVRIVQAWGMTETSPLAALAHPPSSVEAGSEQEWEYRVRTGRVFGGVELRIVDDAGNVLPWDGESVGEIEVRGPWITGSYHLDPSEEKFHDGWLRTGDVGTVDEKGYVQLSDRAKDVIKSGGEWISSVKLENVLMGHPEVLEASVVGIPDERWDERPLACVVRNDGSEASAAELRAYLADHVAGWQLPEHWTFIEEVPKTSVGKFDKKVLRAQHANGELEVEALD
ncbi:MAG TPA: long-chain fatty acid--CoA ligase [Acidimicrobiia bacterium]|jgi:fatty-acyl-CoA synthase